MRKRISALILAAALLLSLGGCGSEKEFMTVEGQSVSEGLFTFYLDRLRTVTQVSPGETADAQQLISQAAGCCREHIMTELFFQQQGIELSTDYKQQLAEKTESLWSIYSSYYQSIGVEKSDITRALSHEYRKKQLVLYYFDRGAELEVPDSELKEEFVDIYVGFRAFSGELTRLTDAGERVELGEEQRNALQTLFEAYADRINDGIYTIDECNTAYNNTLDIIVTEKLEINLVKIGSPMYSESFYEQLMELSHTRAGVIQSGTRLYVVQREKIATTEEDEFYLYRTELLQELKMGEVEEKIAELTVGIDAQPDMERAQQIAQRVLGGSAETQ